MRSRLPAAVVLLALSVSVASGCGLRRQPAAAPPDAPAPARAAPAAPEQEPETATPPSPTLLADETVSGDLILARLLRGRELLDSSSGLPLDPEQRRQIEIGAGFLAEAEEALAQGDLGRADVLSEKALVLIEDVVGGE